MKFFLKYALIFIFSAVVLVGCSESESRKAERVRMEEVHRKYEEKRVEERNAMIAKNSPIFKAKQDILITPRPLLRYGGNSEINNGSWFTVSLIGNTNAMEYQRAMFIWERNPGEYIFSELPMSMIRLKLVENDVQPAIQFHWKGKPGESYASYERFHGIFKEIDRLEGSLTAATISIPKADWPSGVRLSADANQ